MYMYVLCKLSLNITILLIDSVYMKQFKNQLNTIKLFSSCTNFLSHNNYF